MVNTIMAYLALRLDEHNEVLVRQVDEDLEGQIAGAHGNCRGTCYGYGERGDVVFPLE